jgi:hypothetical protein
MNIQRNDALIKRNARIAQMTMLAGLVVLGGGMYVSFTDPDQTKVGWSLAALAIGFILSQVGIYYLNRWGRKPRPDEQIDKALKGMDRKFTLFHFTTPASHLLVGPTGLWVLLPYYQRGTITYSKGRWRQKGGGLFLSYLKIFAQEGLGRPDLEIESEVRAVGVELKKRLPDESLPPITPVLVFTHPLAVLDISKEDNPPAEAVKLADLKKLVSKSVKGRTLSVEKARQIEDALTSPN